jgi:hypothetical protein
VEVVTPRTNLAALASAEHLLGSIALPEPFALEIAADDERRRLMVRAASERMRQQLRVLGAAYPQAELQSVEAAGTQHAAADEQSRCRRSTCGVRYTAIGPYRSRSRRWRGRGPVGLGI